MKDYTAEKGYVLTVDCGSNLGWAAWERSTWRKKVAPIAAGIFSREAGPWKRSMHNVLDKFEAQVLKEYRGIRAVLIEEPSFFQSEGGQTCARSGGLVKLVASYGALLCMIERVHHIPVEPIPVNDWKGQLPKHITAKRIKDILGDTFPIESSHVYDAVGIGLYAKGHF